MSTYHARLNWQRGQLKVLDLSSTNGTLVNGVPVVGWTTLTDGDVIEFGGIEAIVQLPSVIDLEEPAATLPPPPEHESRLVTGEVPQIVLDDAGVERAGTGTGTGTGTDEVEVVPTAETLPADYPPPDDGSSAGGRTAAVTLPPTPPTGITITDIEAVTDGYDDLDFDLFGGEPAYPGPFGADEHPESVRGRGRYRRRLMPDTHDGNGVEYRRSSPAFSREGVSPIVIIVAVALLVVIVLAAIFLA